MKLYLFIFLLLPFVSNSQTSPVLWNFKAKKISGGCYEVRISAVVNEPWHIYSQKSPEGGPIPTKIKFDNNPLITLEGRTEESGQIVTKYEELFELNLRYFDGNAEFVQLIKLRPKVHTNISGTIEYMACNDEQCTAPLKVRFSIPLR